MKSPNIFLIAAAMLFLLMPVALAFAGSSSVNCNKKSLATVIDKLDKTASNIVEISGNCIEDILISGHADLTLIGIGGASITATILWDPEAEDPFSATTSLHIENSKVTVVDLTIFGGTQGVFCDNRSQCILTDVTILAGLGGIYVQGQSALDLIGTSSVNGAQDNGIQVFGASSVNLRPTWAFGYDRDEAGPVIIGSGFTGLFVSDGSFLRADNVTVSNSAYGVWAQRNSTLKFITTAVGTGAIYNTSVGIRLRSTSTGQIIGVVSNNGLGIQVGPLSYFQDNGVAFSGNGTDVDCDHATSVSSPGFWCNP